MSPLRRRLLACGLALAGAGSPVAGAAQDEPGVPEAAADAAAPLAGFSVRGFATLGLARFSNSEVGVISAFDQRKPVVDAWSANLDSVLGAQLQWNLGERDHLLVQAVARAGGGWRVEPALAFWQHRWDSGLRLRLGRIGSPIFRDSEIHHIGYASTSMRPALPVYAKINAIAHLDGAELTWQTGSGGLSADFSLHAGTTGYWHRLYREGVSDIDVDMGDLYGLVVSLRYDYWSLRLGRTYVGRYRVSSPEVDALDSAIVAQAAALRALGRGEQGEALEAYRKHNWGAPSYTSLALGWAAADWRLEGEWTRTETDSPTVGASDAWQLTLARSFGRLTPYALIARQRSRQPSLDERAFAASGMSPQLDVGLAATRGGVVASRQDADMRMRSVGVGARYDVREDMALKLQVERISQGAMLRPAAGAPRAGGAAAGTLVSAALEFIF